MFAIPPSNHPGRAGRRTYTTCQFGECKKVLGAESRDLGFPTCHEHRTCAICEKTLNAAEVIFLHEDYLEKLEKDPSASMDLTCPRCQSGKRPSVKDDPTLSIKQSEYDYLNLIRLCIEPSMELSLVTNENNAMIAIQRVLAHWNNFDKAYASLKMIEACAAQVSIALQQDKKELQKRANEREKVNFDRAKKENLTSSRPAHKPADDAAEILLGSFMEKNGIKLRSIGQKIWKARCKAINDLEANLKGVPRAAIEAMVDGNINYRQRATEMEKMEENGK